MEHELKTCPPYFQDIVGGRKTFEARRDDRDFVVEDVLWLRDWNTDRYTGRELIVTVSYVLTGEVFGIMTGFCVLGLRMDSIRYIRGF